MIKIGSYFVVGFIMFIISYYLVALLLSNIIVNDKLENEENTHVIYLKSNGVHLDIVLRKEDLPSSFLMRLNDVERTKFLAFGWGDENFYLHTPTWNDLTFKTAFNALFLKSSTLMHVTRYNKKNKSWVLVRLTSSAHQRLTNYIIDSFVQVDNSALSVGNGYFNNDNFYQAKGSYSILKTCNTWVNLGFKESGLKACIWTPFDFGLLDIYKPEANQ